jgi:hypothetical protein
MKGFEDLKEILRDKSLHVYLAQIMQLHLAKDFSYLKVTAKVFPEERNIIANMTWENVGPESGDFEFPSVGDMVLVANVEGDDDQAYVIKRLTSREDKIPESARTGDKVHKARSGNKYWNISDSKIFLSRSDTPPEENLVLGQVFKKFAQDLLEVLKTQAQNDADHKHIGNLGYFTFKPDKEPDYLNRKTEYNNLKTSPVNDEAILSDLSYTEK